MKRKIQALHLELLIVPILIATALLYSVWNSLMNCATISKTFPLFIKQPIMNMPWKPLTSVP